MNTDSRYSRSKSSTTSQMNESGLIHTTSGSELHPKPNRQITIGCWGWSRSKAIWMSSNRPLTA